MVEEDQTRQDGTGAGATGADDTVAATGRSAPVPQAIVAAARRRLLQRRQTHDSPFSEALRGSIYPTTMGPDKVIDRLGYGERLIEQRISEDDHLVDRELVRTRSGTTPAESVTPLSEPAEDLAAEDEPLDEPSTRAIQSAS